MVKDATSLPKISQQEVIGISAHVVTSYLSCLGEPVQSRLPWLLIGYPLVCTFLSIYSILPVHM
jgi:hypothetical protein